MCNATMHMAAMEDTLLQTDLMYAVKVVVAHTKKKEELIQIHATVGMELMHRFFGWNSPIIRAGLGSQLFLMTSPSIACYIQPAVQD